MKRIISALLLVCVSLGVINTSSFATPEEGNLSYERFGIGIGCFDEGEYSPDKPVSRAEFARVLANICGLTVDTTSSWEESVYGEVNNDETVIIDESSYVFDDIDSSHPYYSDIIAVYNKGYMVGISESRFAPDYHVSVREVAKVIVDMLGYSDVVSMYGGYPDGYEKIASQNGLLSGTGASYNDIATQSDVLRILYNALDVEIIDIAFSAGNSYKPNSKGKTFMNSILNMYKAKGILTDNGITAISGPSTIANNEIKVDGVAVEVPEKYEEARNLLGRNVEMYYIYDEDLETKTLAYIEVRSNDETISFKAADFVSFNPANGEIRFYDGNRLVKKRLSVNANMIYNNRVKNTPYSESDFIFESGEVTLCKMSGTVYDLIIVKEYQTVYVASINSAERIIYNGIISNVSLNPKAINLIELSEESFSERINITDKQGVRAGFESISVGDVLWVMTYDDSVDVIVSSDKMSGFVISNKGPSENRARNEYERLVITNGEQSYEVLNSYYTNSSSVSFNFSETYTLYLDCEGNVAWADKGVDSGLNIGILTEVRYVEDENYGRIRIFTSTGEMKRYTVPEKYTVNEVRKKVENIEDTDENLGLAAYIGKAILYSINEKSEIEKIVTAADFESTTDKQRGWHLLTNGVETLKYHQNDDDFDLRFYYVSGMTKVFKIPEDRADYGDADNFSVGSVNFGEKSEGYKIEAYASSPNAVEAEIIVMSEGSIQSSVEEKSAFLIKKIGVSISEDLEVYTRIDGYEMTQGKTTPTYTSMIVAPEVVFKNTGYTIDDLQEGDIIRYSKNLRDQVGTIAVAYDMDIRKAYSIDSAGNLAVFTGDSYFPASTYSGILQSKYGNGIKVNISDSSRTNAAFRVSNIPILVVDTEGGIGRKIEVRTGSLDDATAYESTRAYGDRIVMLGHWSSLLYGVVIYK